MAKENESEKRQGEKKIMDTKILDGCMQSLDEMINLAEQFYKNELASLAHARNTDYLQSVSFEIENAKLFRKSVAESAKPQSRSEYRRTEIQREAEKPEQHTKCAVCGEYKNTPLRRDEMGGYVCLSCIDKRLDAAEWLIKTLKDRDAKQCAECAERMKADCNICGSDSRDCNTCKTISNYRPK